jgi:hypothetical protein
MCDVPECCLAVDPECPAMMPREGDECAPLGLNCAYGCESFHSTATYYGAECLRLTGTWGHYGVQCEQGWPDSGHGSEDGGDPDGGDPDGGPANGGSADGGSTEGG